MFKTVKIKLNPQINLPFNFLIQKYFFHDNPTWNINYSEYVFPSRYSEYLLMVKHIKQKKESEKNGIGNVGENPLD